LPSKFYRQSPNLFLAQRLDIDDAKGATVIAGMRELSFRQRLQNGRLRAVAGMQAGQARNAAKASFSVS
jgi:hypothetical protein